MESASPPSLSSEQVLHGDIPHILEEIFLHLDYECLKTCFEVCSDWRKILKSVSFQKKAKVVFATEISMDQEKLVKASYDGNTEMILKLLSTDFLDINHGPQAPYDYATPLIMAANAGKVDAIEILLDRGADPNIKHEEDGNTPLHEAAQFGYGDAMQVLLGKGADPNIKNGIGDTPLSLVLICDCGYRLFRNERRTLGQILLDAGANVL